MTPDELKAEVARIKTLSGDELIALIRSLVADSTCRVVLIATAWKRAADLGHGEVLARLQVGWVRYVPKVIDGSLLPEIVGTFGGSVAILAELAGLDRDVQKQIAHGKMFPFLLRKEGRFEDLPAAVQSMSLDQVRQLIHGNKIRSLADQRMWLESRSTPVRHKQVVTLGKVTVDSKTQTVRIGRNSSPAVDVIKALAEAGLIEPLKKQK